MFDSILIPIDGSARSEAVLFHVQRLLLKEDAKLRLLRVVNTHPESVAERLEHLGTDELPTQLKLQRAKDAMDELVQGLENQGVKVEGEVQMGEPATAILQEIERERPRMVAMASHGSKGLRRLIRGSVAERVLRHCPVPLMLLNPPATPKSWHLRFDRVLVPLDGSPRSARVLPLVTAFAKVFESQVTLLHVMPAGVALLEGPEFLEEAAAPMRELGLEVETRSEHGDTVEQILEVADDLRPDLLVMATHGETGFLRWAFGSTALSVLNAWNEPMLVVRSSEDDE